MSGGRGLAKLNLNCALCGVALSNGVFTCCLSHLSFHEECGYMYCSRCARRHEEDFQHASFRARHLNDTIANGTFVCSFEGCGQDISASHYSQHQMMCPYRKLTCPVCGQWSTTIVLSSHLLTQHQFNHYQLQYGTLLKGYNISKTGGCIFRGRGEDFVFFIVGPSLFFLWLGASASASSQAPASSSAPTNIKLMVTLVTAQTQQNSGSYADPPLPRIMNIAHLFDFGHLTAENAFKISVLIG
ncbi:hypothetical protein GQ55_7G026600 [Panicum hallii var. hallii]|uniref:SIAH-type domain-containing protein n=1 Tax=Panicum hallii var. hallii TaxID=1504633 RepID=A0A2T7CS47_9POAL|nr:hypothetical protein GQ55_7G026600 [Panicum hallii var. hallii]